MRIKNKLEDLLLRNIGIKIVGDFRVVGNNIYHEITGNRIFVDMLTATEMQQIIKELK